MTLLPVVDKKAHIHHPKLSTITRAFFPEELFIYCCKVTTRRDTFVGTKYHADEPSSKG